MKLIITNLKHFLFTFTLLFSILIAVGISFGANVNYGDNPLAYKVGDEGPHVFFENEETIVNYIRGGRDEGFYLDRATYSVDEKITAKVYFPLEDDNFEVQISCEEITIPETIYNDGQPIVAISDIESSFRTFRDFLIANKVINSNLEWIFDQGHLVLLGDFIDRGFSTTQVLWFIVKLEQDAKTHGGNVHFILGNHEIKNLQGNFQKAADKYLPIASILGVQQDELYGKNSFIGRWMSSKNTVEKINGFIFMHGGIHPNITQTNFTLFDINEKVRNHYRLPYFPTPNDDDTAILLSTRDGIAWYRGYFEADLTQQQVEEGLDYFDAQAIVVGHQPQWNVNALYQNKVFAINVKHPDDYRGSFPPRRSQGLLIKNNQTFRLLDNGSREAL